MPTEKRLRQKQGQQARKEAALAAARRRQRKRKIVTFAVIAAVVLGVMILISTVGGDDGGKTDVTSGKSNTSNTSSTSSTTGKATTPTSAKPAVDVPEGPAPTSLETKDLKVGDGPEAKAGDTVEMNYVGVTYADGKQFDSSWDRGETFSFTIGQGDVIKGWDEGVPGMKVGGRRQLVIPGDLAYGDKDDGSGRPFGTLVFVVDLVAVK